MTTVGFSVTGFSDGGQADAPERSATGFQDDGFRASIGAEIHPLTNKK